MVEEAQRHGVRARVGAGEAGAADHDVGAVLAQIRPHALPQKLERALVAIRLEHAGAAKLHEAVAPALRLDQRLDVVFALRVEAVIAVRHLLAQHAIGADHARPAPAPSVGRIAAIDHEQMVEHLVECVLVAARQHGERVGHRRHLLVEDFVAETLRLPDLALLARKPHFERADAAVNLRRLPGAKPPGLRAPAPGEGKQPAAGFGRNIRVGKYGEHQRRKHRVAAEPLRDAPGCQLQCHVSARLAEK